MYVLFLIVAVGVAYVSGSINYAVILTRAVARKDIRHLGNRNPGAANVSRSVGKGWGTLVLFLDMLKALVPLIVFRLLVFKADTAVDLLSLFAVGLFALLGHCRPVFYGFRGGRGIATSLGVYLFFIPVEFTGTVLVSALIVALFIRNVQFRVGRWIPTVFVTLTPFVTLGVNPLVSIPLFAHVSIGGHTWYMIVGVFVTSLCVLWLNFFFTAQGIREFRGSKGSV